MADKRMKILLLGNGLLQSFGGESWKGFLEGIRKRDDLPPSDKINCPEPLKAILLTNDQVDVAMREKCDKILNGDAISLNLATTLQRILNMGFDHILTTNYTYELEQAAVFPKKLTENMLKKMTTGTLERAEPKYLIHTYNRVERDGTVNKIWHIHGEARKPDSTILGHYYYGNSLFKIKEAAEDLPRVASNDGEEAKSWVEAFLLADVYCLGFGYGLAEFDLWWLLNRKAREKRNTGKLYFYEPKDDGQKEKLELFRLMKKTDGTPLVESISLGYCKEKNPDWTQFYLDAIADISEAMSEEREDESAELLMV